MSRQARRAARRKPAATPPPPAQRPPEPKLISLDEITSYVTLDEISDDAPDDPFAVLNMP